LGFAFPKTDRVTRREDFLTAQKRGRRVHASHFVIVLLDRGDGAPARLGLVTSRKVANAVGRNRVRRVLREVFRTSREHFPSQHDVVVIAREGAAALATGAIREEILAALARRKGSGQPSARAPRPPADRPVKP
jgi:ribonuclease P protein component